MKYEYTVFCEHANENPHKVCNCPVNCSCREHMCKVNKGANIEKKKNVYLNLSYIGSEIVPGIYELLKFVEGVDYYDEDKNVLINSIGRNKKTGTIYGSTDTRFCNNSEYDCLFVR